jgi:4-amino-4-deoxy-L-arabinose transferase-like glycosyltransferase
VPPGSRTKTTYWLAAIVLLGAALRLFPIWFGLPYLLARPDEDAALRHANTVLDGDLNPHFFHWPSLLFYLFASLFTAVAWVRSALSLDPALATAHQLLVGRACVALAGTLTIVVLFRIARRLADATTGLVAAGFLAVATLHVRDSHFAMTDVVMTLLVATSLGLLLRGLDLAAAGSTAREAAIRWFGAAGLAGGLGASTKYSAAAILAGMGAAQVLVLTTPKTWPRAWLPSGVFLAAFALGFLIATPYAVLDFEKFSTDLRFDFAHLSEGHVVNLGRGWIYHVTTSLPNGVGLPMLIAALIGIVPMAARHGRSALVVGAFAAAFYASIGSGETVFFRYVLPLVPIVCLLAAVGVRYAGSWLSARTRVSSQAAVVVLATVIAAPALVNSVRLDLLLAKTDTRVLAGQWLVPRMNAEDTLHEAGSQYAQLDLSAARFHRWFFDPATRSFGHPEGHTPDWLVLHESPLWTYGTVSAEIQQLAREKYVLVQIIRGTTGRPADGGARSAVYDLQDAFYLPMSGFSTVERPGPTVSIYRRWDAPLRD